MIFSQGESGDWFYVIKSGTFDVLLKRAGATTEVSTKLTATAASGTGAECNLFGWDYFSILMSLILGVVQVPTRTQFGLGQGVGEGIRGYSGFRSSQGSGYRIQWCVTLFWGQIPFS